MSTNIIGKPQDRVDGRLKVTGRAMCIREIAILKTWRMATS
jgi:CO/xanthine dehydrogenase Mo-binding subunit